MLGDSNFSDYDLSQSLPTKWPLAANQIMFSTKVQVLHFTFHFDYASNDKCDNLSPLIQCAAHGWDRMPGSHE